MRGRASPTLPPTPDREIADPKPTPEMFATARVSVADPPPTPEMFRDSVGERPIAQWGYRPRNPNPSANTRNVSRARGADSATSAISGAPGNRQLSEISEMSVTRLFVAIPTIVFDFRGKQSDFPRCAVSKSNCGYGFPIFRTISATPQRARILS